MTDRTFVRVQQLLESGALGEEHYAASLDLSDPIVPALEYFLSLEHVAGFQGKLTELKTNPVGPITRNDRRVQWASLCAEFGAIRLLGRLLGVRIVGLDQASPRARRPGSNCDVVAVVNGGLVFVEVKRNAAEDKQVLPELLEKRLGELDLPFSISGELLDRNYDCSDLEQRLVEVAAHVAEFERWRAEGLCPAERVPVPLDAGAFRAHFHDRAEVTGGGQYFAPVFADDLRPYLIGPGGVGRDGARMIPMAEQASEKGADYLFCRVQAWEGWPDTVAECFGPATYKNERTYFVATPDMNDLRGIVLFSRYDEFCIINNLAVDRGGWLAA